MNRDQTKDLFQLQSELIDMKVDMAATKAIDRIIEKLDNLENHVDAELHRFRNDMNQGFSLLTKDIAILNKDINALDKRLVAVETRLRIIDERRKGFNNRFTDYLFKAGYGGFTVVMGYLVYLIVQLHPLIK